LDDLILVLGLASACLTMFAFLPQLIKIIRTKHTKDLSLFMLIMLEVGISGWLAYGILISDPPIIVANSVSVTLLTITLILKIKYG